MSISGITPVGRVSAQPADTSTATSTARPAGATTVEELDNATNLPRPFRFPWLSRLSAQLEAAANQRAAFAPAPVLGDNVDKSV